ncbi:MAG: DUF2721 domain-containing protein [Pirellulaceae bacterium]|nr:DUF2721 domain-containing protein [Pirellulaceae bacterium]
MTTADILRELAMPVVMISANGLICLALYNRLAAITARLRLFYRERFDVDLRLAAGADSGTNQVDIESRLRHRLGTLDQQCRLILCRARQVRNALILLLASVVGMLLIMLLIGLTYELPFLAPIVLLTFVASVLVMIGGVAMAIGELVSYLEPVQAEGLDLRSSQPPLV